MLPRTSETTKQKSGGREKRGASRSCWMAGARVSTRRTVLMSWRVPLLNSPPKSFPEIVASHSRFPTLPLVGTRCARSHFKSGELETRIPRSGEFVQGTRATRPYPDLSIYPIIQPIQLHALRIPMFQRTEVRAPPPTTCGCTALRAVLSASLLSASLPY